MRRSDISKARESINRTWLTSTIARFLFHVYNCLLGFKAALVSKFGPQLLPQFSLSTSIIFSAKSRTHLIFPNLCKWRVLVRSFSSIHRSEFRQLRRRRLSLRTWWSAAVYTRMEAAAALTDLWETATIIILSFRDPTWLKNLRLMRVFCVRKIIHLLLGVGRKRVRRK